MNVKTRQTPHQSNRGIAAWIIILLPVGAIAVGTGGVLVAGSFSDRHVEITEDILPDPQEMARVEASADRALEYLIGQQEPQGCWPSSYGSNNGVNALCLLAFLGRGHVPGRGPYKGVVDRAVNYILATQQSNGLYSSPNPSNGPMYEHGLSTLAMIEAYGQIPTAPMRNSVQRAVDLIVKSQSPLGGWRYQPVPSDADLSVTVMQVVALRAAVNTRLNVPKETMDNALKYVKSCAHPDGGFCYQPGPSGSPAPARTAAGILCMQLLGAFDDPAVTKSLEWMAKMKYRSGIAYFWYMNYYAMQAHFQAGGQRWASWHPTVRRFLLENQNANGSWEGYTEAKVNGSARCYSTAIGALCLEVYMHFLPAYQR